VLPPATRALPTHYEALGRRMASTAIVKRCLGAKAWMPVILTTVGASFLLSNAVEAEAAITEGIQEPRTLMEFPLSIHDSTDKKVIIGLGSRQVSFLKINVYVMGMYVRPKDAKMLEMASIWTDTSTAMSDLDHAHQMLGQPIDICIRIVPTRPTGAQHLRDGFTRSLLQIMREESKNLTEDDERQILEAIQDFKAKFPKSKVNKGDEFIFTRTAEGGLKIEFQGEDLGTVNNKWLSDNFVVGYVKLGIVKNVMVDVSAHI